MRRATSTWTARARLRLAGPLFLRVLLVVPALVVVPTGCSKSGEMPVGADLPGLLIEAAPKEEEAPAEGPPARRAVLDALRHVLEVEKKCADEVGKRFWRPELSSYLLRETSYIGGTFPLGTAVILREVHGLEADYLDAHREFPERLTKHLADAGVPAEERRALVDDISAALSAQRRPILAAIEAHQGLVAAIAELYELVGSQPDSLRAMRDGLDFSDADLLASFNAQVETVNGANEAASQALEALDADQKRSLHWMGQGKPVRRLSAAK